MKGIIGFLLGALAIMILDMVWASKGYAQSQVRCENIMYPGTIQIFEGQSCPQGWYPV